MAFMERQVEYGTWMLVDGPNGRTLIPEDVCGSLADQDERGMLAEQLRDYVEGSGRSMERDEWTWKMVEGFGARLSAPGYMDCTEWGGVFETRAAAEEYLDEMYGEEEQEEEEGEEESE